MHPQAATGQIGSETEAKIEQRLIVEPGPAPARRLPAAAEADEAGQHSIAVVRYHTGDEGIEQLRGIVARVPIVELVRRGVSPGDDRRDVGGGDGAKSEVHEVMIRQD